MAMYMIVLQNEKIGSQLLLCFKAAQIAALVVLVVRQEQI